MDFIPPPKSALWVPPRPAIIRCTEMPKSPAEARGIGHNGCPDGAMDVEHVRPVKKLGMLPGITPVIAGKNVPPFSASYVTGNVTTSTSATSTRTGVSLGAEPGPGERRFIVIICGVVNTTNRTLTGGSVAGNTGTVVATVGGSGSSAAIGIFICEVPTGTTGTVSITWSGSGGGVDGTAFAVYRLMNLTLDISGDPTPFDTVATSQSSSATVSTVNVDTAAGGVLIGAAQGFNNTPTFSGVWSQDYSVDINSSEWFRAASAYPTIAAAPGGGSLGGTGGSRCFAAASWR